MNDWRMESGPYRFLINADLLFDSQHYDVDAALAEFLNEGGHARSRPTDGGAPTIERIGYHLRNRAAQERVHSETPRLPLAFWSALTEWRVACDRRRRVNGEDVFEAEKAALEAAARIESIVLSLIIAGVPAKEG